MSDPKDPAGMAALSICEALLLALKDRNVLPAREIIGILRDAAETLENADSSEPAPHSHAAALINRILEEGDLSHRA